VNVTNGLGHVYCLYITHRKTSCGQLFEGVTDLAS
jgi:hypothetical protein